MKKIIQVLTATSLAAAMAGPAQAQSGDSGFSVSGFGTLGFARSNTNDADFRATSFPDRGADKGADFRVDSKLGLQLTERFNDQWSVTGQFLAQRTKPEHFSPLLTMGFVKWQPTRDLSVRVGRLGWAAFLVTDSFNIGYTNPWIRPPVDVYAQVPMYTIDGIDATYQMNFGDTTLTLQPQFGATHADLPAPPGGTGQMSFKSDNLVGINVVAENGPWTFRGGYNQTKVSVQHPMLDGLFAGLRMSGVAEAAVLARQLEVDNKRGRFMGVGVVYNEDNWLVQSEYTKRRTESFMADTTGYYVTAGYRFGRVMPYVTTADVKIDSPLRTRKLASEPALQMMVNGLLGMTSNGQHTDSIGVRWDFAKNLAFKAQYDHVRLKGAGSTGFFVNARPGFDGPVNVISAAVDFVF